MPDFTENNWRQARKQHSCTNCKTEIPPRTIYLDHHERQNGEYGAARYCQQCAEKLIAEQHLTTTHTLKINTLKNRFSRSIQSRHWRQLRQQILRLKHHTCDDCKKTKNEDELELHHLTYENLGNERAEDVTLLCTPCHEERHHHKHQEWNDKEIHIPFQNEDGTYDYININTGQITKIKGTT